MIYADSTRGIGMTIEVKRQKPKRRNRPLTILFAVCLLPFDFVQAQQAVPTFYGDVLPILQQHCQTCHRAGEIGPFPLVTYDDVRSHVREMVRMLSSRKMPPWFADRRCG